MTIIWKIKLELHLPIMNHFNMNQIICSNVSSYYPTHCSYHSHLGKMNLLHQSCNNDLPLDYSHLCPAGPGPISSPECCQDAASNNHLTSHLPPSPLILCDVVTINILPARDSESRPAVDFIQFNICTRTKIFLQQQQ